MTYHILTPNIFKKYYPINNLQDEEINLILQKTSIENTDKGKIIFTQGEDDSDVIYLLSGSIRLKSDNGAEFILESESEQAFYPIANIKPRNFSAYTHSESAAIARLPTKTIESFILNLEKDELWISGSIANKGDDRILDSEWMMAMKSTPLFQKLQDEYLNQLFQVMDEKTVQAGENIITQGEPGDYFYLVKEGTCKVFRHKDNKEVELATLRTTDSFGEDALIGDRPRNATVRMFTDGTLMRISKKDFEHFMFQPIVKWIDVKQALKLLKKGARLIDIRKKRDKNEVAKNAKYIPLFMLRNQLKRLDKEHSYLIFCDDDNDGAIASYLFSKFGLDGYILRGDDASKIN